MSTVEKPESPTQNLNNSCTEQFKCLNIYSHIKMLKTTNSNWNVQKIDLDEEENVTKKSKERKI